MSRISKSTVADALGRHKTKISKKQIKSYSKLVFKEKRLHKKYGENWTSKMNDKEKKSYGKEEHSNKVAK